MKEEKSMMTTTESPVMPASHRPRSGSLTRLKATIVAGSLAAFVATWGLIAQAEPEPPPKAKPALSVAPAQPQRVIIRVKPVPVPSSVNSDQAIALAAGDLGAPIPVMPQFEPLPPIPDLPMRPAPRPVSPAPSARPAPNSRTRSS